MSAARRVLQVKSFASPSRVRPCSPRSPRPHPPTHRRTCSALRSSVVGEEQRHGMLGFYQRHLQGLALSVPAGERGLRPGEGLHAISDAARQGHGCCVVRSPHGGQARVSALVCRWGSVLSPMRMGGWWAVARCPRARSVPHRVAPTRTGVASPSPSPPSPPPIMPTLRGTSAAAGGGGGRGIGGAKGRGNRGTSRRLALRELVEEVAHLALGPRAPKAGEGGRRLPLRPAGPKAFKAQPCLTPSDAGGRGVGVDGTGHLGPGGLLQVLTRSLRGETENLLEQDPVPDEAVVETGHRVRLRGG